MILKPPLFPFLDDEFLTLALDSHFKIYLDKPFYQK
jgi:hypothetical protein